MALNEEAIFTAAKGYIFIAERGTASPENEEIESFNYDEDTVLAADWSNIGHTSRDDLPEFGYDGGDTETRGTWQSESVREVTTDPVVDYVTMNVHQFDNTNLGLYYGSDTVAEAGRFRVRNATGGTVERAICIVIVDGDEKIGFWAPRVSIRREDAVSMAVDEFAALPLRATFLKQDGEDLFNWISDSIEADEAASV